MKVKFYKPFTVAVAVNPEYLSQLFKEGYPIYKIEETIFEDGRRKEIICEMSFTYDDCARLIKLLRMPGKNG